MGHGRVDLTLHPALAESGRFKVKHCLGTGGFGVVFAAFDTQSNANVALKWLRNSDAATIGRFKREFRALADLTHPNLVVFRDLITVAGEWFFTMDLVDGVELLDWVRPATPGSDVSATGSFAPADQLGSTIAVVRSVAPVPSSAPRKGDPDRLDGAHRPLCIADLPRLRSTLEQLAAGLGALHDNGLLHRDIKPSNVLVTRDGHVVLLDFGLVAEMGHDGVAMSMTGSVVGTPAYMSPEQAMGSPVSPASDWYAVGTILFQALTGRVPFEAEAHAILVKKQLAEAPPPQDLVRGVPRRLSELCVDLLARDPERRPSGKEFLERLREALPSTSTTVPTSERTAPSNTVVERAPRFVGRETHVWALSEAADEAERGKTVIALVEGSAGMGKSALVRHFLEQVRGDRPDTAVIEGRCYARESMPFKALDSLMDALCMYMRRMPQVEHAKLLPRDLAALARVFPAFLQFDAGVTRRAQGRGDVVQERRRAFDALRELLSRVADRRPLILFIDDLQWGDGDSEPLLTALFRPPDPPPLLLIVSYRTEDAVSAPLVRALRKLATSGPPIEVCEIPVGELSPDAARELAASLLGRVPEPALAEALVRESFGSPLFLRQLAALDTASERVDLASALSKRIARLGEDARRLLDTLAVSGTPLPLSVAARVAGIEHDAQGVFAKLRAETLVRMRGVEARDEIEIYHDRIREVVVAALSPEALTALHRKLASVLAASGDADAEALARHLLAAGERALAAECAEQAAERATAALAFARAARMYEMALDAASTLGRNSGALHLKLGEALAGAGRSKEAAEKFLQAAKGATSADALELRRRAAEQLLFCGRLEEGLRVLEEILGAMNMAVPKTAFGALVTLLWYRLRLWVRGAGFREKSADQLSRDRLVRIDTCLTAGRGLGLVDPIRGAAFQTRYLLLALGAGEPIRIAKGLALEAAYRAAQGMRARPATDALLAKARDLAARVAQANTIAFVMLMRGVSRVLLGDFVAAVPLCDQASTELRDKCTGVAWELDNASYFSAFSLLACGRIRELSKRLPAILEDARSHGDFYGAVLVRIQLNWFLALANDDVDAAGAELDAVPDEWGSERFLLQDAWRMVNRVDVALYAGDPAGAVAVVDATWPKLEASMLLRVPSLRVRAEYAAGRAALAAALAAKDEGPKLAGLERAARAAKAIASARWSLARGFALLLEAGVASAGARRAEAAALYEKAGAELESKGAHLHALAAQIGAGRIQGGAAGDAVVLRCEKEMREEQIAEPAKMLRLLAPAAAA
jgi:serine/threonine protein kinase